MHTEQRNKTGLEVSLARLDMVDAAFSIKMEVKSTAQLLALEEATSSRKPLIKLEPPLRPNIRREKLLIFPLKL